VNVSGAVDGDSVTLGVPNNAAVAGTVFTPWVSGAGVVKIRACNTGGVAASLPAASFRVDVWQH
jgi:cytoskeletal protein CcmA (bactofilin family)